MASNFKPRIVAVEQSLESILHDLIIHRDETARELSRTETHIATLSRRYADERGLTMRPRIEQLRRELMQ